MNYDGFGINGDDEYKTRIATLTDPNAKLGNLLAAAPELLEALEKLLYWKSHTITYEDAKEIAKAAIAKAKGDES